MFSQWFLNIDIDTGKYSSTYKTSDNLQLAHVSTSKNVVYGLIFEDQPMVVELVDKSVILDFSCPFGYYL